MYIKGKKIWLEAEEQKICAGRSARSMKERFLRILRNIKQYKLSKEKIKIFRIAAKFSMKGMSA